MVGFLHGGKGRTVSVLRATGSNDCTFTVKHVKVPKTCWMLVSVAQSGLHHNPPPFRLTMQQLLSTVSSLASRLIICSQCCSTCSAWLCNYHEEAKRRNSKFVRMQPQEHEETALCTGASPKIARQCLLNQITPSQTCSQRESDTLAYALQATRNHLFTLITVDAITKSSLGCFPRLNCLFVAFLLSRWS